MPLIKNGAVVFDPYVTVSDDAVLPDGVPVIVTAARLRLVPRARHVVVALLAFATIGDDDMPRLLLALGRS